jgi:phage tail sheath protein FI
MALNVGVNVVEVDGRASPAIQAAPTSVAAFIGIAERGVPNQPVRVTNLEQFFERFGRHRSDGFLAYVVAGFFLNGGREAYINRIVGAGSAAAAVTLNNRAAVAAPALRITAGYRGQTDPGAWGDRLRVDVRDDPQATTQLSAGIAAADTSAQLVSLNGLRVGSVVRFSAAGVTFHRRITGIGPGNTINWVGSLGQGLNVPSTQVSSAEFRLTVRYQAAPTEDFKVVEEWPRLSMEADSPDYVAGRINHQFTGSRYVTVSDVSGAAVSGDENPSVTSNSALTGSAETAVGPGDYNGSAALKRGFYAFDTAQVQLVAAPDAHRLNAAGLVSVVRGALDYCAARGDCMFVGSAPDRGSGTVTIPRRRSDYTQPESAYLTNVKNFAGQFQANKVFGALYGAWIRVDDPAPGPAPTRFVPPDGHVLGVYARTELERGIFKAPAGNAAQVRGALDVAVDFTEVQHTDMVRTGLVNGIRQTPGLGIIVTTSRTLSTDTRWWFVNVRLLFNFVKSSLRTGLRFVRQEPHTEELRRAVRLNVVRPFLLGLWRQGAFGSDPPDAVFTIKCDAENNPPTEVNLGNFRVEVYFYPAKPAETILIVVGQQPSGSSASEA